MLFDLYYSNKAPADNFECEYFEKKYSKMKISKF